MDCMRSKNPVSVEAIAHVWRWNGQGYSESAPRLVYHAADFLLGLERPAGPHGPPTQCPRYPIPAPGNAGIRKLSNEVLWKNGVDCGSSQPVDFGPAL